MFWLLRWGLIWGLRLSRSLIWSILLPFHYFVGGYFFWNSDFTGGRFVYFARDFSVEHCTRMRGEKNNRLIGSKNDSQPKWSCKTRHFGYGTDFFPQNLKSGHRLHRDRSKGNTNPNGLVKREKNGGKSHEMKAKSTRPFGLVIAKI